MGRFEGKKGKGKCDNYILISEMKNIEPNILRYLIPKGMQVDDAHKEKYLAVTAYVI